MFTFVPKEDRHVNFIIGNYVCFEREMEIAL